MSVSKVVCKVLNIFFVRRDQPDSSNSSDVTNTLSYRTIQQHQWSKQRKSIQASAELHHLQLPVPINIRLLGSGSRNLCQQQFGWRRCYLWFDQRSGQWARRWVQTLVAISLYAHQLGPNGNVPSNLTSPKPTSMSGTSGMSNSGTNGISSICGKGSTTASGRVAGRNRLHMACATNGLRA